jgi:2-dehydropantoate 2-reductase
MSGRIVVVGAGAVGSYVGGHLTRLGHDVTLVDPWHDHVERMRSEGLQITEGAEPDAVVVSPRAIHIHEVSALYLQAPVDVAFVSVKSYDTEWATTMIRPYLAAAGFVVSLQNCINEEWIAGVVGWGRTLGCIPARLSVELSGPGQVRRKSQKGGSDGAVFRVGEVHGRITQRARMVADMLGGIDKSKVTTNLWGERWSKLCRNSMTGSLCALTGLTARQVHAIESARGIEIRLGAEGVRVGQALGFSLERVGRIEPDVLGRALDDPDAARAVDKILREEAGTGAGGGGGKSGHRPSLGQDIARGRRTEIEYMNGTIARKGREIGLAAPTHERVAELVGQIERGKRTADPTNLEALSLS